MGSTLYQMKVRITNGHHNGSTISSYARNQTLRRARKWEAVGIQKKLGHEDIFIREERLKEVAIILTRLQVPETKRERS